MRVCVLNNIEDIFETKAFIDKYLIDNDKAKEKMELNDFILKYCNLSNKIYVNKGEITPFELHTFEDEQVIILADNNKKDEVVKKLEEIKYNFGSPVQFTTDNLEFFNLLNNSQTDFFIINKQVHKC